MTQSPQIPLPLRTLTTRATPSPHLGELDRSFLDFTRYFFISVTCAALSRTEVTHVIWSRWCWREPCCQCWQAPLPRWRPCWSRCPITPERSWPAEDWPPERSRARQLRPLSRCRLATGCHLTLTDNTPTMSPDLKHGNSAVPTAC